MDDESVRRRSADPTRRGRAGDAHAADRDADRDRRVERRLRDASTRDEKTLPHQVAEDSRRNQHNVGTTQQAVNSAPPEPDSELRVVDEDAARDPAVEDGDRRRDDPVQRARIAVDQLVTRERKVGQQRAEGAHTEQVNRWHHEDRSASRAALSFPPDSRIDGGGVAR